MENYHVNLKYYVSQMFSVFVLLQNGYGINHDDKEIALWKALCSSFNILMHELKLMGLAVEQCTDVRVEENASVALVLKNLACNMEDNWIIEMTIFLTTGVPPQQLTTDERKRLTVRSRNFFLLNDTLYHKGADGIC